MSEFIPQIRYPKPIEDVCNALNRVLEIDRAAIQYLLIGSVETCEEMLADPLLQVEEIIHTDGSKNHRVSPLALLNMVVEAATGQRIAAQFEIEGRTVEAARQKQRDDRVGRSVICPFLVKFTPYEPDAENRTEATT